MWVCGYAFSLVRRRMHSDSRLVLKWSVQWDVLSDTGILKLFYKVPFIQLLMQHFNILFLLLNVQNMIYVKFPKGSIAYMFYILWDYILYPAHNICPFNQWLPFQILGCSSMLSWWRGMIAKPNPYLLHQDFLWEMHSICVFSKCQIHCLKYYIIVRMTHSFTSTILMISVFYMHFSF